MSWIPYPTTLKGELVTLYSLEEKHFEDLIKLAADKRIWEFYVFDGTDHTIFSNILTLAIAEQEKGNQFPFVIYHNEDKRIIGSTRFLDIQPKHKKLEIGFTWLHPDYWATAVNAECKLLLLSFCFETLHTLRVQLKTDENNIRSRKAIEKIGGRFEGVLKNDMLRDNGTKRNSAYYSITDDEWEQKKEMVTGLYQSRKTAGHN